MAVTGTALRVNNLRGYAQGEIFLLKKAGEHLEATVYNTTGFGPVPAAEFDAIDVERLAAETGADLAWKNPRRFWTMDAATVSLAGEPRDLQGLMFNLMAKMHMPPGFDPGQDQSALAYRPNADRPGQHVRIPQRTPGVPAPLPGADHLGDADLH